MDDTTTAPSSRILGVAAMKALGHPIRTRLFNELSSHGPSTASELGRRLGESSGSTSYHLRQLAKHQLVEDCTVPGTGRVRVWRRTKGAVQVGGPEAPNSPAAIAATAMVTMSIQAAMNDIVRESMAAMPGMAEPWREAADFSTIWLRLTPEEMAELDARIRALVSEYRRADAPEVEQVPGSRRVYVNLNIAPVVDEEEDES